MCREELQHVSKVLIGFNAPDGQQGLEVLVGGPGLVASEVDALVSRFALAMLFRSTR